MLLDTVVASVGIISLMIPLVNMVAVSLPEDQRGVGIGMNTLIRSIGSSVGPVISTVFMDTYTAWIGYLFNNQYLPIASVPSSEAFHYIYLVGICLMFINLLVALLTKNYVLKQKVKTTESVV